MSGTDTEPSLSEVGTSRWDVPVRAMAGRIRGCVSWSVEAIWEGQETLGFPSVRLAPDADVPAGRPYLDTSPSSSESGCRS